jgi:hypothetical protein
MAMRNKQTKCVDRSYDEFILKPKRVLFPRTVLFDFAAGAKHLNGLSLKIKMHRAALL